MGIMQDGQIGNYNPVAPNGPLLSTPGMAAMINRCEQLAHAAIVPNDYIAGLLTAEYPHLEVHVRPDLAEPHEVLFGPRWAIHLHLRGAQ